GALEGARPGIPEVTGDLPLGDAGGEGALGDVLPDVPDHAPVGGAGCPEAPLQRPRADAQLVGQAGEGQVALVEAVFEDTFDRVDERRRALCRLDPREGDSGLRGG